MQLRNNLYNLYELNHSMLSPARYGAYGLRLMYEAPFNPFRSTRLSRQIVAGLYLFERLTRKYERQGFGIKEVLVGKQTCKVREKIIAKKPFCNVIHFEKEGAPKQEKLFIVAPMSGHFATLLKNTVEETLPFFDVYITDWKSASEVPLSHGNFDLDDFIDYLIEFCEGLKGDFHMMGVCQPTVPVAAAVAIMENEGRKFHPKSMILVGGPIDGRINPTMINEFADKQPIEWFEKNLINTVPLNYAGAGRRVYPGFLQLAGFISMKPEQHYQKHRDYFNHLVEGDGDNADKHEKFYDEYLSVMDLSADFYLQTIKKVFQDFDLPRGKFTSRGRPVKMENIRKTALLALEGERDDIAGVGQSKAALKLCANLPDNKKDYYLQMGVGHYGVFSGSKFREFVVPVIRKFIAKNA